MIKLVSLIFTLLKEKVIKLLLISELLFPCTLQILFKCKLCCSAKQINVLSSLKGIIVEKKPDLDNIFDIPPISSLNVNDDVKRALFLEEFLVI